MPSNFFNFSRYFNKKPADASDKTNNVPINSTTTKTTISTTQTSIPTSQIKETPIQNQPSYNINASSLQINNAEVNQSPSSSTRSAGNSTQNIPQDESVIVNTGTIDMNKRSGMDILTRLTQRSNQALMLAVSKAKELKSKYVDTEHVLWGLLSDAQVYQLISEFKVNPKEIQDELEKNFKKGSFSNQPQFSPRVKKVLELALSVARALKLEFISPEHILLALAQEGEGMAAQILAKFHIATEALNKKITGKKEGITEEEKRKTTSVIEQYCEDLTQKAREGKLDPVVGRSAEIERTIHILSRRTKNNPCLIGDAGVGKTAIVEGLAQKIAKGDVPETLLNKRILQLDLMSLIAGASHRGEFEERLKNLIKEIKAASGVAILFIDEIHNMVGAGSGTEGTMDASNILKPSLARGELQTIGTTTITEYRKYIEKDPALERRFQPVLVLEPSEDQAIEMLHALRDKYEAFHKVSIPDETIEAAVKLSKRYVGDRFLPDKAVDLIDEAAAAVRLPAISLPEEIKSLQAKIKRLENEKQEAQKINDQLKLTSLDKEINQTKALLEEKIQSYEKKKSITTNVVSPEVVQEIVSRWTNIPVARLTEKESDKLIKLEDLIHKRIIDQEQAVAAISEAVRRGRAGLKSGKRPIGSFIFMGPTGVGKTELAKALAEILFGSEDLIVRLDMTEYMEKHEVAKLIGAPPGYIGYEEGGQLTEAVRRHPYSVVLFDEIEKAHPDVFNILIQLLDDGRLTDNKGRTISFKNTIVICTSNIGTALIQQEILNQPTIADYPETKKDDESKNEDKQPKKETSQEEQEAKTTNETTTSNTKESQKSSDETNSETENQNSNSSQASSSQSQQNDFNFEMLAERLLEELRKFFRPELLNRFDEVIIFRPLSYEHMIQIVDLQLTGLTKLLEDQHFGFEATPAAKEKLAQLGYDPIYGARPLRRTIQRYIENPISTLIIKGEVQNGDTIILDLKEDEFDFTIKKTALPQQPVPENIQKPPNQTEENKEEDELTTQSSIEHTQTNLSVSQVNTQEQTASQESTSPTDANIKTSQETTKTTNSSQTEETPDNQPPISPLAEFYSENPAQTPADNSTSSASNGVQPQESPNKPPL